MRIRTIKPEFWKSERMCGLGAETRLLAIGLLNYADDEGYFLAHPALIRGELMPFAEGTGSIQGMLDELVEIEFLRIGEDAAKRKIGLVVNFKKHQRVDRPQPSKLRGNVEFPNGSPTIPGILAEGSTNDQGLIDENSTKDRGVLAVGMEGNGMEKEGIREGSGKPSPSFALRAAEGGDLAELPLAGSSMQVAENAGCNGGDIRTSAENADSSSNTVADEPAEEPKKKKGGAAAKKSKKEEGPEWPEDFPVEYREVLLPWWLHKREQRQGYKSIGWLTLCARERNFPAAQVKASVEASMANNWSGLFTMNTVVGQPTGRGDFGAKKRGAAGPVVSEREPVMVVVDEEPEGWRVVWPDVYPFAAPERWNLVPESNRRDVLAALRKKGGGAGGFECPVPCDWRVVWDELFAPLRSPETWEAVMDVARKQIVARIEAKKNLGGKRP